MGKISLEKYERGRVLLELYSKFPKDELAKQLMLSFEQYIKWVHVNATGIEYDMTDSHKRVAKALQDIADGLNTKRNLALALPVGCVTGDTLINCKIGGEYKPTTIRQLYKWWINDKTDIQLQIRRYIVSKNKIEYSGCNEIVYAGIKPVYKVSLSNGKSIKATIDHPLLTPDGYIAVGNLKQNSKVMVDTPSGWVYEKVSSVEYKGEEDTYCCICDTIWGEEPNFSANDIMIHNFGKSLIVQYWITWCFARNKQCMFCYIAYADKLIKKLSKEARDIIGSEFWINVFGNELRSDDKSKLNFSLNSGGKRTGLTAGTMSGGILGLDAGNPSAVGFGGALIIDDPLPTEAMSSEYLREDAKDIYHTKLETRRRTPTTPTVLLMQRLHKDDLIGHLKETEPEDWEFIDVPALNADGTSFYPSRFPVKELENIKARSPYKFYAMYQQDPINYGGTVFKQEWIQTVDVIPQKFKKVIITSDTAMKAGENNDYSVFQCWGLGEDNNAYLLDQIRGKWEAPELLKQAIMFFKKCKTRFPKLHRFYVEDKASGTGLIQTIKRQTLISICPIKRGANKNKVERANDVTCHFECGRVFFYKFLSNMGELVAELLAFDAEMNHKHDDQVDCLTDALAILLNQKSNSIFI